MSIDKSIVNTMACEAAQTNFESNKGQHQQNYINLNNGLLGKLEVTPHKETTKLKRQIAALKYAIDTDTREKDRQIHTDALRALEAELIGKGGLEA